MPKTKTIDEEPKLVYKKIPLESYIPWRTKYYYGWTVVFFSGLLTFTTTIGHTPGINMFVDHFVRDLKVTRT